MPQWRKLHVKATESLDINDMPDDFHRLLWVLLPLGLDREGRGVDNPSWIKSKVMPLRTDITPEIVSSAMDWYDEHGMIERYTVDGRDYFWVPTFARYQGNTSREAQSEYPPPPSQVNATELLTNSRPTQELVESESSTDVDADVDTDTDTNGAVAPPVNLDGWLTLVQESKNRPAALRRMHDVLYPGRDPPDYGYIGRTAKTVGGAGRLAALLWQSQAFHPNGDVLRYCMAIAKGRKDGKESPLEKSMAAVKAMLEREEGNRGAVG